MPRLLTECDILEEKIEALHTCYKVLRFNLYCYAFAIVCLIVIGVAHRIEINNLKHVIQKHHHSIYGELPCDCVR